MAHAGSSSWASLVRTAVVGTQREAAPAIALGDDELDALMTVQADATAEDAVLRAAAVAGLARRAGARPLDLANAVLDPAPGETLPRCSPEAASDLAVLLGGGTPDTTLLPEWLAVAAQARVRVPEELLPQVLAVGTHRRDLRAALVKVIGARGGWLAAQEPEWAFALGADDPERAWHEGDRAARALALAALRAQDAAHARELLGGAWRGEPPAERAVFVDALRTGLSMADEPFLETVLDDRRKDVRGAAVALLARLPESRLVQRAIARGGTLVAVKRTKLGAPSLSVELPSECTPEMQRDGVEPRPPAGTGERAWWLQQIVAQVPPSHWTSAFGIGAATMIALARKTEAEQPLLHGLAMATAQYGDETWRLAWIDVTDDMPDLMPFALSANTGAGVATAERVAAIVRALDANDPRAGEFALVVPGPWDVTFSRAFVQYMQDQLAVGASPQAWALQRGLLTVAAVQVAPETPGMLEGWPENMPQQPVRDAIAAFCDTVRLRAAMRDHLKAAR